MYNCAKKRSEFALIKCIKIIIMSSIQTYIFYVYERSTPESKKETCFEYLNMK